MSRRVLPVSLVLLLLATAGPVLAQNEDPALRSAGRKLALDGIALFQQGKAQEASDKLEKAYQLLQVPSIALWSARALEKRGLLVEASERYMEATRLGKTKASDQEVQQQAQRDAAKELESLTPRIPSLTIVVTGAAGETPSVLLDGKPVPPALLGEEQPVNPGKHDLKASFQQRQISRQIKLTESEKKTETLRFDEPVASASDGAPASAAPSLEATPMSDQPASAGHGRKTFAFVALAAGGAGLVAGGVTGALALSKRSSLEESSSCRADVCLPSQRSDVESLDTLRTVSSVAFIAGGALAATGVVLLLTSPPAAQAASPRPHLALRLGAQSVSLAGSF